MELLIFRDIHFLPAGVSALDGITEDGSGVMMVNFILPANDIYTIQPVAAILMRYCQNS